MPQTATKGGTYVKAYYNSNTSGTKVPQHTLAYNNTSQSPPKKSMMVTMNKANQMA